MIICIQARMNSSRLPGKVMMPLCGKPMLYRLIERMKQTNFPIIVCTGSKQANGPIVKLCRQHEIDTIQWEDEADVMNRLILAAGITSHEDIVRVTGDNPLTDPDILRLLTGVHLKNKNDYTYIEGPPSGTRCEVINVKALQTLREITLEPELQENMTPALKTMKKVQKVPCPIEWYAPDLRLTVDTKEDMVRTQTIYRHFKGKPPLLAELITWIKANLIDFSGIGQTQLSAK